MFQINEMSVKKNLTPSTFVSDNESDNAVQRIAYVLLWFPLASETFIFREIDELRKSGLEIIVYTLYGKLFKGCSECMKNYDGTVRRLGIKATFKIILAFFKTLIRRPCLTWQLLRKGFFRRMRNIESLGENLWSFLAGFLLADMCASDGINLIHSSWANGPATASWIASRLSGIPFAFTGRAGDIYPQDGILAEKAQDALFIRTNNAANVKWLQSFCPTNNTDKVKLIYNSFVFSELPRIPKRELTPPYRLIAIGRFVRTKGFPELLTAVARLKRENFPVMLTLVGDGAWKRKLIAMINTLKIQDSVHLTGFVPNDSVSKLLQENDLLIVPSVIHKNGDRDGIPNVIMEALFAGKPVVATDVCGISEIIRNGETGILIPSRDTAALSNAIRYMFENWSEALRMADNGRFVVKKMFDPVENSRILKELYINAAAGTSIKMG